jgi:hypothetical protein
MEIAVKQNISFVMCDLLTTKVYVVYDKAVFKKIMHTKPHTKFPNFNECPLNFQSTTIIISLTSCSTSSAGAKRDKKYNHAVARAHTATRYSIWPIVHGVWLTVTTRHSTVC